MKSPADVLRIRAAVVAQRQAEKLRRIAQVHAASLREDPSTSGQAAA